MKPKKVWYAPREMQFTRYQTEWALEHLAELRIGLWPPEASNYIDLSLGERGGKTNASFVVPVEIAAELEVRLEHTGIDGIMLEAIVSWGKSEQSVAISFSMSIWTVRKRCKQALRYIASGPNRRWHNTKKRKAVTYKEYLRK